MATDQRSLPANFGSNTDFQNWVAGIHAQLSAVGLVNTSDTGQINPATVAAPVSFGTTVGYEIWRFNDTLQATLPVFVKVEYGSSPFSAAGGASPGLALTVGTLTNGAGTLSGQLGARRFQGPNVAKGAGVTLPSYVSSDGSGLMIVNNHDLASVSFSIWFVIDRTRDGAGNPTGDGIYTATALPNTQLYIQVIPVGGSVPGGYAATGSNSQITFSPTLFISNGAAPAVVGSNVPLAPVMYSCGKAFFSKMLHLVQASQVTAGTSFSASILGGTHTVIPLQGYMVSANGEMGCFLWE